MPWTLSRPRRTSQTPKKRATACASRRPCSRPAFAEPVRQRGSSGLGPNAANESSSANTLHAAPANAAISAAGPGPNADGAAFGRAGGHQDHRRVTIVGNAEVDRAAHTAVHVAPPRDRHRRPGTGHGTTGRHRVDEPHTRVPIEDDELAGGGVDRGEPQLPVRPVVRRQALGDHVAADGLGHGLGRQRHRPDPPHLLTFLVPQGN